MDASFTFNFMSLNFPEPKWREQVERWYQIDAPSYALCESYWQNRDFLKDLPQAVYINSPDCSFKTDQSFCKTLSPSKFVHTLPSVRTSALFQLLMWRGPMYSFVGEQAEILRFAQDDIADGRFKRVWVIEITELPHLKVEWRILEADDASV